MTRMLLVVGGCATNEATNTNQGEAEQADSAAATFQEVYSGSEATAQLADQTTYVHVDVFENRSNQVPGDVFLFYQYSSADLMSYVCNGYCFYARWITDYGYGSIPATDVNIGASEAHVHTTTSVAGFTTQQCVFDQRDYSSTCSGGVAGDIELWWNRDGLSTQFSSGLFRETAAEWTYQTQGTYWTSSAQAHGVLPSHEVTAAYGALNDSRTNTVSKSFTRSH